MSQLPDPKPRAAAELHPAEGHATPADVPGAYDPAIPFWLPDWQDSIKLLGWRWALVAGLAVGAILLGWLLWHSGYFVLSFAGLIFKLGTVIIAASFSLWAWLGRSATQYRRDPFCIHCGYSMEGHNDGETCPECGRPCSFAVCREYKRDPHWFAKRYRARAETPIRMTVLEAGPNRRPSRDGTD